MFQLPFRRKPRPTRTNLRQAELDTVTTWLANHPDSPSMTIATHTLLPISLVHIALEHLEIHGLVTARWTPGPTPRRRLYRLTPAEATPKPGPAQPIPPATPPRDTAGTWTTTAHP